MNNELRLDTAAIKMLGAASHCAVTASTSLQLLEAEHDKNSRHSMPSL